MNLRPYNFELLYHCSQTQSCQGCNYRIGCPIRHMFYQKSELEIEIRLQAIEIKFSSLYDYQLTSKSAWKIRNKIEEERKINPYFSYM